MQAMTRGTTAGIAVLLAAGLVLAGGGPAAADTLPDRETGGGQDGQDIWARTGGGIVFEGSVAEGGQRPGNLTVTGNSDWSPPPCWYAPYLGAEDFKREMSASLEDQMNSPGMTGHAGNALVEMQRHYEDGYGWPEHPGYEDYNTDKEGEGMFWAGVENPAEEDFLERNSCSEIPYWVDDGGPQPPYATETAIDPEMLAALAYERIRVPDTDAELRPEGEQTVNLPTWVWLDSAEFEPVSVTARVPVLGMWATTTATPVELAIEAGTEDADLHPSDGRCPINDDGTIGTPYQRGDAEETPPCGLTYLRSSESTGPYDFKASVTWEITWSGSDGTEDEDLPSGIIEATQELEVQEIQTVIR